MAPTHPTRRPSPLRPAARRLACVLGAAIAWGGGPLQPAAAAAQPTAPSVLAATALVLALRPLDFAAVLPGISKVVDAVDPHGGVLEVRGDPTKQVRISLTLPAIILTTGGVFLPVTYGTSDAILSTAFDPTIGTRFDPNAPRLTCLNPSTGSVFVFLGGRVLPAPTQRRGQYAGTVIANVTYTGAPCP
ncbi:MAG: hypothetical protein HY275_03110 [Gemmatimonadetes bacterium]|nr:hypothetical protein [Gemmatimonadota bacterium]